MNTIPTAEFYDILQKIYHIFNEKLFEGTLPNCLITVQRKKSVMGYFSSHRWVSNDGIKIHELALNPAYFTSCNFIEVFQTMVHEMCHLWQFEHGKPSRRSYHNKEWAQKMESIGLIPSSTGVPGGSKTGQNMNDYPQKNGLFERVCIELYKNGLFVKWFDRFPEVHKVIKNQNVDLYEFDDENIDDPALLGLNDNEILQNLYTVVSNMVSDIVPIDEIQAAAKAKQKTKYICNSCGAAVWGRDNLNIKCNSCNIDFEIIDY
ncbi:MAG: SprT-like domain-containing protein [Sulfurovaceae bacterium]|nr:SprT-like domain-containing protein [Sulfurovaceae bacterium]